MKLDYYIFNPTGNTTALVIDNGYTADDYRIINDIIMKKHPEVEQVGFADFTKENPHLHMAGGEFCGNATMCTAVLFCHINKYNSLSVSVNVFGMDGGIRVNTDETNGNYYSSAEMPKEESIFVRDFDVCGCKYRLPIVNMPGIAHVIADKSFDTSLAKEYLSKYAEELSVPAMGIMIIDGNKLTPIVYVKFCNTLFFENSCASGSCAVGAYLAKTSEKKVAVDLIQPGGILNVEASAEYEYIKLNETIRITGHFFENYIRPQKQT